MRELRRAVRGSKSMDRDVCRLERGTDMYVSTLESYRQAVGAD